MIDTTQIGDTCESSLIRTLSQGANTNDEHKEATSISGVYRVDCRDADGSIKWSDEIQNVVTTVGKNKTMDTILGNVAGGAIVMGLKGAGTAVAADTQASHASWPEITTYTGNRPTPTFSAASAGAKTTSSASTFAINGSATVAGCFINIGGSATPGDTTGTLFSAGDFTAGSRAVINGDTLSVSYTATAT